MRLRLEVEFNICGLGKAGHAGSALKFDTSCEATCMGDPKQPDSIFCKYTHWSLILVTIAS